MADRLTPHPQQESDEMQITTLDGTPVPSGPRVYTRRQVGIATLTGAGLGIVGALFGPGIVSRLMSEGSSRPQVAENPYALHPQWIQSGAMETRLTTAPNIYSGLALRSAPQNDAPLVDPSGIDTIGVFNPDIKRFVGQSWPSINATTQAPAVALTIFNLALQASGQGKWGVLQVLSKPIVSTDPKTNGKQLIHTVYFDMSGPSLSSEFEIEQVVGTNTQNATYTIRRTNGTTAEIPIGEIDQVSNVSFTK
ncbi:MAG TPA: hypothetical protein VFQ63_02725 [Patescibacteria group bacterium]|nr:hypothetical protein [Patescibacteria group bacterium]